MGSLTRRCRRNDRIDDSCRVGLRTTRRWCRCPAERDTAFHRCVDQRELSRAERTLLTCVRQMKGKAKRDRFHLRAVSARRCPVGSPQRRSEAANPNSVRETRRIADTKTNDRIRGLQTRQRNSNLSRHRARSGDTGFDGRRCVNSNERFPDARLQRFRI